MPLRVITELPVPVALSPTDSMDGRLPNARGEPTRGFHPVSVPRRHRVVPGPSRHGDNRPAHRGRPQWADLHSMVTGQIVHHRTRNGGMLSDYHSAGSARITGGEARP